MMCVTDPGSSSSGSFGIAAPINDRSRAKDVVVQNVHDNSNAIFLTNVSHVQKVLQGATNAFRDSKCSSSGMDIV
jgi:hypothetical protein